MIPWLWFLVVLGGALTPIIHLLSDDFVSGLSLDIFKSLDCVSHWLERIEEERFRIQRDRVENVRCHENDAFVDSDIDSGDEPIAL